MRVCSLSLMHTLRAQVLAHSFWKYIFHTHISYAFRATSYLNVPCDLFLYFCQILTGLGSEPKWVIQSESVQRGLAQWQGARGLSLSHMDRILFHINELLFYVSGWFTLLPRQTPEKKANDQRVRKRKADHFDGSQGRLVPLLWSSHHVSTNISFSLKSLPLSYR